MDETPTTPSRGRQATDAADQDRPSKRLREDPIRPRVSRACDRCKSRKTRCSGTWPCVFCAHLQLECQFTAAYRRGQLLPGIDVDTVNPGQEDQQTDAAPAPASERVVGSEDHNRRQSLASTNSRRFSSTMRADAEPVLASPPLTQPIHRRVERTARTAGQSSQVPQSMRNSPEPSQTDEQGHYVGPASGVSFLLRIQRKLQVQSPGYFNSSVFNFGDRPLPGHDSSFAILPPKTLAESMVMRYFDFAATTHRFLHRPSIEMWLEELYETHGAMLYKETARSRTAVLFMVFAHSNNYRSQTSADTKESIAESAETSARFFAVAEHQLSMEKGEIRLPHVQARLAQCFYLLAQSRLNHCWTLFGVAAHLAMALGIHRKSRIDPKAMDRVDHVDLECRKRTFWCAYNLNTYLSAALGRPMTFHDEDVDQELPLCVDDDQLRLGPMPQPVVRGPSITSATVAQIKLSRILARILRALYGIRPPSTEEHFTLAAKFNRELSEWRDHISYLLDTDGNSALFVKLVLRQRDVLKLAFWHAQILVHRPFLLKSFTSLGGQGGDPSLLLSRQEEMQRNIKTCIEAATQIVQHIDRIDAAGEFYSTLFFIPYYGFSAVVILYVYAIQQNTEAPETYSKYFRLASKCHSQVESIAIKGSLMQRYGVVLQELRMEVLRNNNYLASASTIRAGATPAGAQRAMSQSEIGRLSERDKGGTEQQGDVNIGAVSNGSGPEGGQLLNNSTGLNGSAQYARGMPAASGLDTLDGGFFHITNWGQFDSLVTGGMGSFDALLQGSETGVWDNIDTTFNA